MNDETELPEHVRRNRVHWDARAAEYAGPGERAWARQEPTWGIWRVPDSRTPRAPGGRRQGRDRARMRHGVHLGVARPPWGARGRDRQLCCAGDGPPARDGSTDSH